VERIVTVYPVCLAGRQANRQTAVLPTVGRRYEGRYNPSLHYSRGRLKVTP